jgi:DNA-directed RNA polymerase subunit omega
LAAFWAYSASVDAQALLFSVALTFVLISLRSPWKSNGLKREEQLNSELCRKALDRVGNPNILVNVVSRRVRQLTGGGSTGRPLVADTVGLGAADVAMLELIEGKLDWEAVDESALLDSGGKKKKKA